jgi:hypothetical protein
MEKYFVKVSATYTPQNQAQREAIVICQGFDHSLIIGDATLKKFKALLAVDMKNISDAYPRCKAIEVDNYFTDKKTNRLTIAQGKVLLAFHTVDEEYDFKQS